MYNLLKLLPLLTISLLFSCNTIFRGSQIIDSELLSYVEFVENELDISFKGDVIFGELPDKVLGTCNVKKNLIVINDKKWDILGAGQKEILIMHEMVHCFYDVRHNEDRELHQNADKDVLCPASIMRPHLWSELQVEKCLDKDREFYYTELNNFVGGL